MDVKENGLGEFDLSHLDDPMTGELEVMIRGNHEGITAEDCTTISNMSQQDCEHQVYASKVMSKLSRIATDVADVISLIRDAPKKMVDDNQFGCFETVVKHLLSFSDDKAQHTNPSKATSVTETQQDESFWNQFWNDTETISSIDLIKNALRKRTEYMGALDDDPTFSLGVGLTQATNMEIQDDVQERIFHPDNTAELEDEDDGRSYNSIEKWYIERDNNIHPRESIKTAKRMKHKSNTLISPFVVRFICLNKKCDKQQVMIVKWLIDSEVSAQ